VSAINPEQCPLCGWPNGCQLCSPAAYKGPCWYVHEEFPAELLARVPDHLRNRACICQNCVAEFHRAKNPAARQKVLLDDFYFESGMMVFTSAYHLRRGFCCGSGCRHCPFPKTVVG